MPVKIHRTNDYLLRKQISDALNFRNQFLRPDKDLDTVGGAPAVTNAAWGTYAGGDFYACLTGVDGVMYWNTVMPARWDLDGVRFRFYWKPSSTNTGVVRWSVIEVTPAGDGMVIAPSVGTTYNVDDTGLGVAGDLQITDWSALATPPGVQEGDLVTFILQRTGTSGSDTFTGTAELLGVQVEWISTASDDA